MNIRNYTRFFGILNRQFQTYINTAFKDIGLGYSECIFLANLYENEGINQEELSSFLIIDKAITAKTIKSLETKGFLIRTISKKDRRAKNLYLTDKGLNYKEQILNLLEKWIEYISDGIDKDTLDFVFIQIQIMAEKAGNADYDKLIESNINHEIDN